MTPPLLPDLAIPTNLSRSTSAHGLNGSTGRPAKWTHSHQRKLARLYVYTTLPLNKIIDVVHQKSTTDRPGTDSANKKIKRLFDTEPRWLHPKNTEDMGRRVNQLALSPSRMSYRSSDTSHGVASPVAPEPFFLPVNFKSEGSVSPIMLDVPPHSFGPWSASAPTTPASYRSGPRDWSPAQALQPPPAPVSQEVEDKDKDLFAPFLRRATVTSASTTTSNSSFKTVLAGYSTAYRGVVKGLIRRFTGHSPLRNQMSPISEANSAVIDWLDDDEAPTQYQGRPFPLPGDFLYADYCQCSPHGHDTKHCLFLEAEQLERECFTYLPWVTSRGLTQDGLRILNGHIMESDWSMQDTFGNTLLHFVAARGPAHLLYNAVIGPKALELLQMANTAGQTFLHVMHPLHMQNPQLLAALLPALGQFPVDIYAQDHYGRNFFHMLKVNNVSQSVLDPFLDQNAVERWNVRDAFGQTPGAATTQMTQHTTNTDSPLDAGFEPEHDTAPMQTQLLKVINKATQDDPKAADTQGRNGLHCLAATNLSLMATLKAPATPLSPVSTAGPSTPIGRRRPSGTKKGTDSSEDRMTVRLDTLQSLLAAGVQPNSYDKNGNTPLMAFAAQLPEDGNYRIGPEMLKLLIKRGAEIDARNRAGETALHIAVRCGRKLAARTLVTLGANVHARDAMGRSILDVADAKIMPVRESEDLLQQYAHWEACRAWLSGEKGGAIQNPTVLTEWGRR